MIPILHWPDEAHPRPVLQVAAHLHHVQHRDALGDGDDELDPGVGRLDDGVRRVGGRDEDAASVGARLLHRLLHGVEDGHLALKAGAAAAGRHARHELRPVGQHLLGVEAARRAGDALDEDARVPVDEDAHDGLSVR